jgi:hypothetical protein
MTALPQFRMTFEPIVAGEEDRRLGLRSRLGGNPTWEQHDETPTCGGCRNKMTFVGQIDSISHDSRENPHKVDCLSGQQKFMFGDVGLIYVFFCFDCLETRSVFQCG